MYIFFRNIASRNEHAPPRKNITRCGLSFLPFYPPLPFPYKMTRIKIFVASAKELHQERSSLKSLANDLTVEYAQAGHNVSVTINDYENFGDDQKVYNDFIQRRADMVVFILDGRIGQKTSEELLVATQTMRGKGRPKVHAFLRKQNHETAESAYVQGLVWGCTEQYCTEYADLAELRTMVKDTIRGFINRRLKEERRQVLSARFTCHFKVRKQTLLTAVLTALCCFAAMWAYHCLMPRAPFLIVTGGGSAANMIKEKAASELASSSKFYTYMHMPTEQAWSILADEMNCESDDRRKYFPICVSASRMKPEILLKRHTPEEFTKRMLVVEHLLGKDPLEVTLQNDRNLLNAMPLTHLKRNEITIEELADLIRSGRTNLFSTSASSGTLTTYLHHLVPFGVDSLKFTATQFWPDDELRKFNSGEKPYLVLSTHYYHVKALEEQASDSLRHALSLKVIDNNGNAIQKDMFLYFVAYNQPQGIRSRYVVPEPTRNFLKAIAPRIGMEDIKQRISSEGVIESDSTFVPIISYKGLKRK